MKIRPIFYLILVIITASSTAYTRTKNINVTGQLYEMGGVDSFNPLSYIPYFGNPLTDCPGEGAICVIDIPYSDIYTLAEVNQLGKPQVYVGQPKVDINTASSTDLSDDIFWALISISDPTYGFNGRVIYEKW